MKTFEEIALNELKVTMKDAFKQSDKFKIQKGLKSAPKED